MNGMLHRIIIAAWNDLRAKQMRAIAALLGMVVAITAVIVLNAATILSQAANEEFVARQYGRPATVALMGSGQADAPQQRSMVREQESPPTTGEGGDQILFALDQERLLRTNGIESASLFGRTNLNVIYHEQLYSAETAVISPRWNQIHVVEPIAGIWPGTNVMGHTPRAVVSPGFASTLGLSPESAIGTVFFYAESSSTSGAENDRQTMTLRPAVIETVATWSTGASPTQILLVTEMPDSLGLNLQQIRVLANVHPDDIPILEGMYQRWASTSNWHVNEAEVERLDHFTELGPLLRQQEVTATIVTIIALTTAGFGILGVGLASIRERSRDFGIRAALGATPADIFWSVQLQSIFESLVAAVIAVPIAALIVLAIPRQLVVAELPLPSVTLLPLSSILLGVGAAVVVGSISGVLPAVRAARLSVIRAVRS